MSRVHIGVKGARVGAWITPPGQDASSENARFILDSEGDMLIPHEVITGSGVGDFDEFESWYTFAPRTILFTTPLSYVPLVFLSIRAGGGSPPRAYYPMSLYVAGPGGADEPQTFLQNGFEIRTDRVTIDVGHSYVYNQYHFNLTVFKNRLIP
jgi:hypothetical protein